MLGTAGPPTPRTWPRRTSHTAHRVLRILAVLAFAWILVVQLPSTAPGPSSSLSRPDAHGFLTFRTDASAAELSAVGADLLEDYGGFSFARGPASALARLIAAGHRADQVQGRSVVHFVDGAVDVAQLLKSPAAAWAHDDLGRSLAVVHFHAPIKSAWRTELEARGVDALRYIPEDAYVVRGTSAALDGLWSLPYVDWVGPYDASRKMRPGTAGDASGPLDVRIAIFPGERPEALEAWLAHQGISGGDRYRPGPGIMGAFGSGDFRWVRARIPPSLLPALADLTSVEFIDVVRAPQPLNAETDWVLQTNVSGDYRYWTYGLDGRGQVVGIADTGLDYDGPQFRESAGAITNGDIYNTTDMNRRKVVRYVNMGVLTGQITWPGGGGSWDPWSIMDSSHLPSATNCTFGHGTAVASTLAGNDNGIGTSPNDGNALGAKLYIEDIGTVGPGDIPGCTFEDSLVPYLPENLGDLFGPANLGYNDPIASVRIHSDSWGTATFAYDLQAQQVDAFVWSHPDFTILFAAGNNGSEGPGMINTPGTAKDLITVGGAYNPDTPPLTQNDLGFESSRGPTADGRIKPTILALFDGDSAMSDGNPWSGSGQTDAHWMGTSYATPAAAAAVAILRQYLVDGWYPTARPVAGNARAPSAALIRAMLIASGTQVTGSGSVRSALDMWPNNEQGFGRILLSQVLPISAAGDTFSTQVVDATAGLRTGDAAFYSFYLTDPTRPLRFVLAWSDYPAALGAAKALVNDLDLEVTAPDGTVYRGNNFGTFAQGGSVAGGSFDDRNVEEAVLLKAPLAGVWRVRVLGSNVVVGPQPFALVATGGLDAAYGRVFVDRPVYSESDAVGIRVEDADATAVQVLVSSSVEPGGEVLALSQGSAQGIWTGTIRTVFGPPAADGLLEVQDGDTIRIAYADISPGHTDMATARVDAAGPVIFNVAADQLGTTTVRIQWRTDEAATSGIRYGVTPLDLNGTVGDGELRTYHAISLSGLTADTLYYYDIVARDWLGHETRDTNGGRHYRFRTAPWGDVLLVIGDASFPEGREASYAAALDARGWTWSVWRIADAGPPPLSLLQQHRAVIWQVGLEEYPAFDEENRSLVKAYLDGGGRLLVVSHDAAWSLASQDSQWRTAASDAWLRGVLKASFSCDPLTSTQVNGTASDPISGAYTAGIGYTPHRPGGATDELTVLQSGGTSTTVWTEGRTPGCLNSAAPIGLRWISAAGNGTSGVGAWGGRPSRLEYFAFEFTGLDTTSTDLRPNSPIRASVLDDALRWLVGTAASTLDRDHPDVHVTAPNGGTFVSTTIQITWTAAAFASSLANLSLHYSSDAGQSWSPIATVSGASTSYAWDVSSVPNGDRYLVRIVGYDSGTPSLKGQDDSDIIFTIDRSNGDTVGPSIWAGSVHLRPNPPIVGSTVWFNATADDTRTGDNVITGAEFFLAGTQPPSADDGLGTAMNAADGGFDNPLENVTWNGTLGGPLGAACIWVHAMDSGGNWGPYGVFCPDTAPPAAADLMSMRLANGGADIEIEWNRTWDDGLYGGTATYRVLRSDSPQAAMATISGDIPATRAPNYTFLDSGAGLGNASDFFYRIETIDGANNSADGSVLGAKFHLAAVAGMNLLGMPLDAADRSLAGLAGGIVWADAWAYDACAATPGWTSAVPGEEASFTLGPGRGFWINVTSPGSFVALGIVPATARISLCAGWNLVALPGFAVGTTVAELKALTGASEIAGFDPADVYHTRLLGDSEVLVAGIGFWIRVPSDVVWSVPGW